MKRTIFYLLLVALLGITISVSLTQQNQNAQKPNPEIEALKGRISELESKLQTVENVEKMELRAKLAEANAKLANAEIDKYKRELRDANDEWLKSWSTWFLTIIGIFIAILIGVSAVFWFWLRSRADQLIADSVEKSLNGFKEAMGQVDILENQIKEAQDQMDPLKNQIRVLKKENAILVLRSDHVKYDPNPTCSYPEKINVLPEETLLDVFDDEMCELIIRGYAAKILTHRQSTRLISPLLKLLNTLLDSVVDIEIDKERYIATTSCMTDLVKCLEYIPIQETYEGLTTFLNRLLSMEDPGERNWLLTGTVSSLAYVILKLDKRDSVPELRKAIPYLQEYGGGSHWESILAGHFDRIKDSEAIKEFLIHLRDRQYVDLDLEERLLNLLKKHDPDFVEEWKAQKEIANTQNKESS